MEDDLTSAFILDTIFETEKEQREKKQYKPLPPKKQREKSLEDELFELLMKKTKPQLRQILATVGLKPRGSPTKEYLANGLATSERIDRQELLNKLRY